LGAKSLPEIWPLPAAGRVVDLLLHLVLGDAVALLELALQLFAVAGNLLDVIVRQLAPLLFDLAF